MMEMDNWIDASDLIIKTPHVFDLDQIATGASHVQKMAGVEDDFIRERGGYSVSLVHRPETPEPERLRDGAVALWDRVQNRRLAHEDEFTCFNEALAGTYLETLYRAVKEISENRVCRMRLIWLGPETNYAFHRDRSEPLRFHIAVKTNENCVFLYRLDSGFVPPIHVPADGHLYRIDASQEHTFINASHDIRLHVLFTCPG